jgi:lipopolysaccharide export system permease protein
MTFNRIQRYILKECVYGLFLVLGIMMLAIMLVDIVEQMRTVGGDVALSPVTALRLSLMKMPMLIEQTLPFAVLISSMIAFTRLNRRSELSVIRASGISAWRFLTPVILLALVLGVFTTTILNPFSSRLTSLFETERASLLNEGGPAIAVSDTGIWLRQGDETSQIVIHARQVEEAGLILKNVKMIEEERLYADNRATGEYGFVRRIDAKRAFLRDGFWQLENVIENQPYMEAVRVENLAIPTTLDAVTLLDRFASPATVGFWELPTFVRQTRAAGLDASSYQMRWHSLMSTPALFLSMGLIGAIVCLRLQRLGGTPRLLATGAFAAVTLFFVTQFAESLGSTGAVPPIIAAWAPPLFFLFCTLTLIAYREDG